MKKRLAMLAIAGVLAVSSLAGCGSIKDDEVVATVNGDEVTLGLANFYARMMQAQYESMYSSYLGEDMWSTEIEEGKTYEDTVKAQLIKELENMYLLEDHMEDYDVTISDEDQTKIKEAAAEFSKDNGSDEKDKVSGSKKNVRRYLTLFTISQRMSDAIQATADMEVSDEEAAQKSMQYVLFSTTTTDESGNSTQMSDEEKEQVQAQAEAFAEGVKSAEDFAAYAAEQGYEVQTATFDAQGSDSVPDEVATAGDALEEGGVTDAVSTDSGIYVAQVTSLLDREATDAEKETIRSDRKQKKYDKVIKKWRKKADISVKKSAWKKVDFSDLSVTIQTDSTETDSTQTDSTETDSTQTDGTETDSTQTDSTQTEESAE